MSSNIYPAIHWITQGQGMSSFSFHFVPLFGPCVMVTIISAKIFNHQNWDDGTRQCVKHEEEKNLRCWLKNKPKYSKN